MRGPVLRVGRLHKVRVCSGKYFRKGSAHAVGCERRETAPPEGAAGDRPDATLRFLKGEEQTSGQFPPVIVVKITKKERQHQSVANQILELSIISTFTTPSYYIRCIEK